MTLGFAFVAALVYLAWLLERPSLLVAGARRSRSACSPGSRSRATTAVDPGSSWQTELADWVHISAASLWIGGLSRSSSPSGRSRRELRARGVPPLLAARDRARRARARRRHLPRARPRPAPRATSGRQSYGEVLLVKIALVAAAVAWGGVHHFLVRPRLAAAGDGFLARVGREPRRREPGRRSRCCSSRRCSSTRSRRRGPLAAAGHAGGGPPLSSSREPLRRRRARSARPRGGSRRRPAGAASAASSRRSALGVGRLAQPDVAERLGGEVVDGDDARRRPPRTRGGSRRRARCPRPAREHRREQRLVARAAGRRRAPGRAGRRARATRSR